MPPLEMSGGHRKTEREGESQLLKYCDAKCCAVLCCTTLHTTDSVH